MHLTWKPYGCGYPDCGHKTNAKKDILEHIDNKHKTERKFKCKAEGCTKETNRKADLRRHFVAVHTVPLVAESYSSEKENLPPLKNDA
ncbi:Oidioi.mRNA.OKI2018_I69.chr2.g4866.t1.cds [Oikopleura dioica]|uniref:Oidioi.mRNA.OKI2018_I69.chr2.g4866.t1.cds n=1 Tax=Oikopleura dioica TaxID=34765 RepID=A0ABN7T2E1_OIKDI|nr:Oidioi.mRNA.OKI2018_I69.chr2.g4866.t1.cds [Oikopleura dioica]